MLTVLKVFDCGVLVMGFCMYCVTFVSVGVWTG
jgi:hypothetical protein